MRVTGELETGSSDDESSFYDTVVILRLLLVDTTDGLM
jgi:hypothetical protein